MAKVLLVEDDNNLREIYQARLMAEGYDIVSAQNGEDALVMAKQNKPDLIISDVMMPRISGFEMLDILRNTDELKSTKVIMLTALGQAEDQSRADNLGADKYLVKSQVTLEDIVNAAKELLGEEGTTAAPAPAVPEAIAASSTETPAAPTPEPIAPAPAVAPTPEPVVVPMPAPDPTPTASPVEPPAVATPTPAVDMNSSAVPASVVPQPDTTVVVPPAPANPEPPTITTTPLAPEPTAPADPVSTAPTTPDSAAPTTPPVVTPSTAPDPTAAANSVASNAPQSIEAEEAALQAQIDGFSSQAGTEPVSDAGAAAATSNDQAIANAVNELNAGTEAEEPAAETTTPTTAEPTTLAGNTDTPTEVAPTSPDPAPATEPATADNVSVNGKKVIQPLNDIKTGPNLDELLAKEAAKEGTPPAAPVVNGTPGQTPPTPPATPGQSFDPNSISL